LRQLRDLRLRTFVFACVIFLRLLRFLNTFYFACVFFLRKTLRALSALRAFEWKQGFISLVFFSIAL